MQYQFLTLKSLCHGIVNHEFEYPIEIHDAIELLNLSKHKIAKTRYQLNFNEKDLIVDSFKDLNSSLTIAEIELESELEEIKVPPWCGQEITGNKSLSNSSLAQTPISKLSMKNRMKPKET